MAKKPKTERFTRSLETQERELKIDTERRTVELSFSSELPVNRWFGKEILLHDANAIDLSRMTNGAAVLEDHGGRQIGVVEKAWLGDDKRLYAELRFSKSLYADEVYQDIVDEIRRNVSFGYQVNEMKLTKEAEDGDEYTVTKWMPYEISIVSVPADPTVGVGRSLDDTGDEGSEANAEPTEAAQAEEPTQIKEKVHIMPEEKEINVDEIRAAAQAEARKEEMYRVAEILTMGQRFQMADEARKAVSDGMPLDQFRAAVLDAQEKRASEKIGQAQIGMSEKEVKDFSFVRAIRAMMNPAERKNAGFEIECSQAAEKQSGKEARGIIVPFDVIMSRDFNETTGGGSNLQATNLRPDMFIDMLRNKMAIARWGALMMPGLVGDVAIPRQTAATTAYWFNSESADITAESNPTVDQVTLNPKSVGAYTDVSRKLLLQATPSAETLVRNDLAKVLALAIDLAALAGSGANGQPTGVIETSGIGGTNWATANTPTWAEIVGMETAVDLANALEGEAAYLMGASLVGKLKTTSKDTGSGMFLADGMSTNGYPIINTNQLAAGRAIFGIGSDLVVGMWGGLDLTTDNITGALRGNLRLIAIQDVDIAVRRAASFAYNKNVSDS